MTTSTALPDLDDLHHLHPHGGNLGGRAHFAGDTIRYTRAALHHFGLKRMWRAVDHLKALATLHRGINKEQSFYLNAGRGRTDAMTLTDYGVIKIRMIWEKSCH